MRGVSVLAAVTAVLAGCATPPPDAYVKSGGGADKQDAIALGANAAGEACTQQTQADGALVYCGAWQQPSARVLHGGPAGEADLQALATSSPWRSGINLRFECGQPVPGKLLDSYPAVTMNCTRKLGGWPQVALAAIVNGRVWFADGVQPAVPPMERAIGVASGVLKPEAAAAAGATTGLAASRLAALAFSSNDVGKYEDLMKAGAKANQASKYSDAEEAYRTAAALQERVLGRGNPAVANALMSQALQLSDQGRFAEAETVFALATPLATSPQQEDDAAPARLAHYRALDWLNRGKPEQALPLLDQAEAGYIRILPPRLTQEGATGSASTRGVSLLTDRLENQELLADPVADAALYGAIEVRRARAVALRLEGKLPESDAAARSAEQLASARGLSRPIIAARLYRTSAIIAGAAGHPGEAIADLSDSSSAFARGLPNTRPYAETSLLLAAQYVQQKRPEDALVQCRHAQAVLVQAQSGTSAELMQPCLEAYLAEAKRTPDKAQAVLSEMFEAAQQVRGSVTSQQIAQATARLIEGARDPRVAELMRNRTDTSNRLADLNGQRSELAASKDPRDAERLAALDKTIAEVQASYGDVDAALQAASPNLRQLEQPVVHTADLLARLHPGEAFAQTILAGGSGTTFVLRDGRVAAGTIEGGTKRVASLVDRIRASMEVDDTGTPHPFDAAAAQELYSVLFGGVAEPMKDATALSVVPAGPLLSIPFALLLTGPADAADLAHAPFLVRRMTVAHVPAPANFVTLRRAAPSAAADPWFGFGDFHQVTRAQAEKAFPPGTCAESAALLSGLPLLPGARAELEVARKVENAGPGAELLGSAFTAPGVKKAPLHGYRILHFATHALLPTDLACVTEPAIVTSPPPGAVDAKNALLSSSEVSDLKLDADTVILSACNTGGPNGVAGESLSGLARSFFYAGARSLLVAHWAVNDRYAAYLVALTLSKARATPGPSFATALAAAQRQILDEAKGDLANQAHPFYWAPLALIGEGSGGDTGART